MPEVHRVHAAAVHHESAEVHQLRHGGQEGRCVSERFPDVDWYCDRCNAHLNSQSGFDDNKYTWKCEACGHKNSLSRDNIYESQDAFRGRDSDD